MTTAQKITDWIIWGEQPSQEFTKEERDEIVREHIRADVDPFLNEAE